MVRSPNRLATLRATKKGHFTALSLSFSVWWCGRDSD